MDQKKCGLDISKKNTMQFHRSINPFARRQILGSSKLEESVDDNFKFDGKGSKVLQKDRKHCRKRRNCLL